MHDFSRQAASRCHLSHSALNMKILFYYGLSGDVLTISAGGCFPQGDPPDNFKRLWKFFLKKSLPSDSLIGTKVAVFGLGDSGYVKYNARPNRYHQTMYMLHNTDMERIGIEINDKYLICKNNSVG